jgi:DNA-binding transcriptional MerR regulator
MGEKKGAHLQIGEVAERTGVTQRTLRFYEEKGLLRSPSRMEGGFRLYSDEDVARVERIKRLQNLLGVSLAEIKEMVDAEEVKLQLKAEYRPEADVKEKRRQLAKAIEVTEKQYAIVSQKVEQLAEMKTYLEERLKTYKGWKKKLRTPAAVSR